MPPTDEAAHDNDHNHEGSGFLGHHFESHRQQFDAGKLGMWLFLVTEVLFFSGLFCVYAVYRANHPEIFAHGHQYLDRMLGAVNTCVLIFSSLTMAWGVRCAQLNQRQGLVVCLIITLACAFVFLGIKYVEYDQKWKHGLLWGKEFHPTAHEAEQPAEGHGTQSESHGPAEAPRNLHLFFSIYFAMTGLHALHIVIGMGLIGWILSRAMKGHFSAEYYGPVDFVGLYWHLVDLIWIYLFPLLYLIH